MSAMPVILLVLACLAIAYRYYSAFLAAKVAVLDDSRPTPAILLNDGQNYHPTHKWVLFGHHFAAISGAGPLIGPVLAMQFGYLPGLIWIVVGVCLAGAVQDMLVLAASVRHGGRSLAEIARAEIGPVAGVTASITILFVVVIALAGLGIVVVKALGGEEVALAEGTVLEMPNVARVTRGATAENARVSMTIPAGTRIVYPNGKSVSRSEAFAISGEASNGGMFPLLTVNNVTLPAGIKQQVRGSSWGTFTIACTIPIALFVGLYMYRIRKGRVFEASLIGAAATLAVTVIGSLIPGSALEPYFQFSRAGTIWAICLYGFIASVLPVWLLLAPRDYLSSFLKIGTVALLVGAVIIADPKLEAPPINAVYAGGGGPTFDGPIFPFCFICIMCGAISGFHSLVSSGTTPKMVSRESHIRTIGYGAMLIEGLVGVVALIAAATLPQGNYYALNVALDQVAKQADNLKKMHADTDTLAEIEQQVGGESLRGRTGGAVTLAVGMSKILNDATDRVTGGRFNAASVIKYWYHFAIMFEALFILTTIDAGTRIARFLLQEALGKMYKPFDRTDWLPGAILSTAVVTASWGLLIASGSIDTIWPMFGIANQMLAVIALAVVTTWLINNGRRRYAPLTILPMLFVIATTTTAGIQMSSARFLHDIIAGLGSDHQNLSQALRGGLNLFFTLFMIGAVMLILGEAIMRWLSPRDLRPKTSDLKSQI
ncbi:MAG TPA: carbon starvation protein A [Pirellulales bacterium]|nr:carbon starvation protein A [Pirellulales bacterium]